ncbi:MAG: hypothetical protein K2F87_01760 [Muribaculaceae bacterium]|nr:hypothetical protein [Muribaculaceae bacterium]
MKKLILLSAAIAALCLPAGARAPQPVNPPSEIPANITVSPAQGFVDVGPTASPLGVSAIGLTFTQEIVVNRENKEPALLYYNDFDTPAETTLSANVNPETWLTGSVLFKERTWTLDGLYKVEIPAGMFLYASGQDINGDRTGTDPTPALTLYYEIYKGYVVTPGSGTVQELSRTVISFSDADEVTTSSGISKMDFFMDNSDAPFSHGYQITDSDGDGKKNDVVITYGGPVSTPGVYTLLVPADSFKFRVYGENYSSDNTDFVEYSNPEMVIKYTVARGEAPAIEPDPAETQTEFSTFQISIPEDCELFFVDTMGKSPIYGVDAHGNVDTTKQYAYAKPLPRGEGEDFITLNLFDPLTNRRIDTLRLEKGAYCLRIVSGFFYGSWTDPATGEVSFGGSEAYDYIYTVGKTVGVDKVADAEADGPVFNLQGVKVAEHLDASTRLPKGIYISAGRKVVVR